MKADITELLGDFPSPDSHSCLIWYDDQEDERRFVESLGELCRNEFRERYAVYHAACVPQRYSAPYFPFTMLINQYLRDNGITAERLGALLHLRDPGLESILSELNALVFHPDDFPDAEAGSAAISLNHSCANLQIGFMEKISLLLRNIIPECRPAVFIIRDMHYAPQSTQLLALHLLRSLRHSGIMFIITAHHPSADSLETLLHTNRFEHLLEEFSLPDVSLEPAVGGSCQETVAAAAPDGSYFRRGLDLFAEFSRAVVTDDVHRILLDAPAVCGVMLRQHAYGDAIAVLRMVIQTLERQGGGASRKRKLYFLMLLVGAFRSAHLPEELKNQLQELLLFFSDAERNEFGGAAYRLLSHVYLVQQNFPVAMAYAEKALKFFAVMDAPRETAEVLYLLVKIHYAIGDVAYREYYTECERLCRESGNHQVLIRLQLHYVYINSLQLGLLAEGEAERLLEESYRLAGESGNAEIVSEVLVHYGHHTKAVHRLENAIYYYEKAIQLKKILGAVESVFQLYNSLGFVFYLEGDWKRAVSFYQEALVYAYKVGDILEISLTYLNMGDAYIQMAEFARALECLEKSLTLKQNIPNIEIISGLHGLPKIYNSLALCHAKRGDAESCARHVDACASCLVPSEFDIEESRLLYARAMLHKLRGEYDPAIALMAESIEKCSWEFYRGELYFEQGLLLRGSGDFSAARDSFAAAAQLYRKGKNRIWEKRVIASMRETDAVTDSPDAIVGAMSDEAHQLRLSGFEQASFEMTNLYKKINQQKHELEEANSRLREWDRIKSQFYSNVSHDFRSPLTVILNKADLALKRQGLDERTHKSFSVIHDAALRLQSAIDRLLELSRMDEHGISLRVKRVPLVATLRNLVKFYSEAVSDTGIHIISGLPLRELDDFYTDEEKLEEILANIISNAIKYVDPVMGFIKLSLTVEDGRVHIAISDNGIGIRREHLEKIFDRYEQVRDARPKSMKSTGIGLAFSRQLAGMLGGGIRAESEGEGMGSCFTLTLPLGREHFAPGDFVADSSPGSPIPAQADMRSIHPERLSGTGYAAMIVGRNEPGTYDMRKAVILVVEDDDAIREIIVDYLSGDGYQNFVVAVNGRAGLAAALEFHPDIIISDYQMPLMNGQELRRELSVHHELGQVPFVFLSATPKEELVADRADSGAIAFITKPIAEQELLMVFDVHLKRYLDYQRSTYMAFMDELTGLSNKRAIVKSLHELMSMRAYSDLAVLFMDIDHFKRINDRYGHPAGDVVLRSIGKIIRETIREYDRAGRYGGEEFLIILPDTGMSDAIIVAQKLRAAVMQAAFDISSESIRATASFGVASLKSSESELAASAEITSLRELFEPNDPRATVWDEIRKAKERIAEALIQIADQALYRAKATTCRSCGFASVNAQDFADSQCPVCHSTDIETGRNRVQSLPRTDSESGE